MILSRFAVWRGSDTYVDYVWYCPIEDIEAACDGETPATSTGDYAVPAEILNAYGDPGPKFVGGPETPTRLNPISDEEVALFGGRSY